MNTPYYSKIIAIQIYEVNILSIGNIIHMGRQLLVLVLHVQTILISFFSTLYRLVAYFYGLPYSISLKEYLHLPPKEIKPDPLHDIFIQ